MSDPRFAAVAFDSGQVGVFDRKSGASKVCANAAAALRVAQELNSNPAVADSLAWHDMYVVVAELSSAPKKFGEEFEIEKFTDSEGGRVMVYREFSNSKIIAMISVMREDEGATMHISQEDAPALASAILRATGLNPNNVELPER